MKLNYNSLKTHIEELNLPNSQNTDFKLKGISSVHKKFISSKANLIGVKFDKYKVVEKNQFSYNPNTARMGDKIPIALNNDEKIIVSQIYPVFKIKDTKKLLPEYLMMWFKRPEFDRYARFKSHGSAREIFDFKELENVSLPIPDVKIQEYYINRYSQISDRIIIIENMIKKLNDTLITLYREWFEKFNFPNNKSININPTNDRDFPLIPEGWKLDLIKNITSKVGSGSTPRGGKDTYKEHGIPLIRSQNVNNYEFSQKEVAYIDEQQAKKLDNVMVEEKDILINITGASVGRCCMVPKIYVPSRVNQHVMIIRANKNFNLPCYLQYSLCATKYKNILLGISAGSSTKEALNKNDVENCKILIPDNSTLKKFEELCYPIINIKNIFSREILVLNKVNELLLSKLSILK